MASDHGCEKLEELSSIWRDASERAMKALSTIELTLTAWNMLDWLIVAALFMCIIWGAYRGLRSQLLSILGFLISFIVASRNYEYLIPWVRKRLFTDQPSASTATIRLLEEGQPAQQAVHAVIAFSLLFIFVLVGLWLLKHLISRLSKVRPLRTIDRLVGALLGIIQFLFVWCIVYILFLAWPSGIMRDLADQSYWMHQSAEWLPIGFATAVQWIQWF